MLPVVGTNTDTTVEARWTIGPRNAESVESTQADQLKSAGSSGYEGIALPKVMKKLPGLLKLRPTEANTVNRDAPLA